MLLNSNNSNIANPSSAAKVQEISAQAKPVSKLSFPQTGGLEPNRWLGAGNGGGTPFTRNKTSNFKSKPGSKPTLEGWGKSVSRRLGSGTKTKGKHGLKPAVHTQVA